MHTHQIGAKAHKARSAWVLAAGLAMSAGMVPASAQTAAPPATGAGAAPSEALQRQANSPYRFILQNANAPTRKPAPAAAPAPAPAEAKRPAAVEQAAAQPSRAAPVAAAPAPQAAPSAPAAAPAPAPVAALTPPPVEAAPVAAVRRELIPIRTDSPKLSPTMLRERPTGTVRVQFDVNPDGSTGEVKVLSSPNRALNRPTIDAVSGWKFQPVDEVLTVETELAYTYD